LPFYFVWFFPFLYNSCYVWFNPTHLFLLSVSCQRKSLPRLISRTFSLFIVILWF
jgi:hypothetical protein